MSPVRATSVLTGVLWYSTGQKWSLCYQKVNANVHVICCHLCIKPRTFGPAKNICVIWGSVLCESVLTKFYCTVNWVMWNKIRVSSRSSYTWLISWAANNLITVKFERTDVYKTGVSNLINIHNMYICCWDMQTLNNYHNADYEKYHLWCTSVAGVENTGQLLWRQVAYCSDICFTIWSVDLAHVL